MGGGPRSLGKIIGVMVIVNLHPIGESMKINWQQQGEKGAQNVALKSGKEEIYQA